MIDMDVDLELGTHSPVNGLIKSFKDRVIEAVVGTVVDAAVCCLLSKGRS